MNWQFTRPGSVTFMKDEPYCFVTPLPHLALDEIKPLAANPELAAEYKAWNESRTAFNSRLAASGPETVKEAWQRFYLHGSMNGGPAPATHKHKRRLANPVKEG